MAKTRQQIKQEMTTSFVANSHIKDAYGLTEGKTFEEEFSLVSIENIIFDIISYAIYLLSLLFDTHQKEINQQIANQKKGSLNWYRYMALSFQYGFDLIPDTDKFDNSNATIEQIESSKIIKYAAVNDAETPGTIVVKIAGETDSVLSPITSTQMEALTAYFEEIKYAGSRIRIINYLPDLLFLTLKIYRDPLVINEDGTSIINGGKPVETAIKEFMKELPFNGELVLAHLVDKIQAVEGVRIPHLIEASSSWVDAQGGYGTPQQIDVKTIAVSGYFKIPNFDTISYVV